MARTSTALMVTKPTAIALRQLATAAHDYLAASRAPATRLAYRRQWRAFEVWCGSRGISALPAEPSAVALYATALAKAGRKVATIEQAFAAIAAAHRAAGHPNPRDNASVAAVAAGIRRDLGVAQVQKAPVLTDDLRRMVGGLPATLKGARDRALLLLGFAGGFRRSELVALNARDLTFDAEGRLTVVLRRSKTDQEGAGRKIGVPFGSNPRTCPVRAVKAWLAKLPATYAGPVFQGLTRHATLTGVRLAGGDVARIVKATVKAAGLDPGGVSVNPPKFRRSA